MEDRRVVVKGGGSNLYKISSYRGIFYIYKVKVGLLMDDKYEIGKTQTLEDALSVVKSHSGKEIDQISTW